MAGISIKRTQRDQGLREINLRTDLPGLVDLMEIVFFESMDYSDRAAIRDMRALSDMSTMFSVFGRFNGLFLGVSKGYVWIEDGKLIGNVSLIPARWPGELGSAWQIVNVGVHPDYQRRGIARKLMQASLDAIRHKGGKHAILQVAFDNDPAINLYEGIGFIKDRAFSTWRRSSVTHAPPAGKDDTIHITHPRTNEWSAEYALAQKLRPNSRGGLGWQRPLHPQDFRPSFWKQVGRFLSMNSRERLIIRTPRKTAIAAALWIERGLNLVSTSLTLMIDPEFHDLYGGALLNSVLRRYRSTDFVIEHPHDDIQTNILLKEQRFFQNRTHWHMRWTEPDFSWPNLQ